MRYDVEIKRKISFQNPFLNSHTCFRGNRPRENSALTTAGYFTFSTENSEKFASDGQCCPGNRQ